MDVLVVFGSKSDSHVYSKVLNILRKNKIDYEARIISAHKTPEEIDTILAKPHKVVISGAGLAAALPGAIAAKTTKPVIGIPVHSDYQGLDALLSIAQMPPGIPVLAAGVNQSEIAALSALKMLKKYETVSLIGDKNNKALVKAEHILKEFEVDVRYADKADKDTINLEFVYFDEPIEKKDELVIYCPLLLDDDMKAEAALNLLQHSSHGLWVGLNRGENAALAAIEILNLDGSYDEKLNSYRSKLKEKTMKSDEELKNNS